MSEEPLSGGRFCLRSLCRGAFVRFLLLSEELLSRVEVLSEELLSRGEVLSKEHLSKDPLSREVLYEETLSKEPLSGELLSRGRFCLRSFCPGGGFV